jgi:hypothetical protein
MLAARVMETERQAQRRANVMTIAAEAADSMPKDESQVSDVPVDKDWSARFFADAPEVSAEELQRLWGRILAREVSSPGGVPLRTLGILRDLSVHEAALLRRFATCCATGGTYVDVPGSGLELHELAALQDAGLVDPVRRHLAWHAIAEGEPDFAFAQARFGSRFTNRLRPSPFVGGALGYPSGHGLLVQAASSDFKIDLYVVRPSAAPLLKLVLDETSLSYLRAVVTYLNSQGFFQARVREPTDWTGEPFGEGTVSPGARLLESQQGAADLQARAPQDPLPEPDPTETPR